MMLTLSQLLATYLFINFVTLSLNHIISSYLLYVTNLNIFLNKWCTMHHWIETISHVALLGTTLNSPYKCLQNLQKLCFFFCEQIELQISTN